MFIYPSALPTGVLLLAAKFGSFASTWCWTLVQTYRGYIRKSFLLLTLKERPSAPTILLHCNPLDPFLGLSTVVPTLPSKAWDTPFSALSHLHLLSVRHYELTSSQCIRTWIPKDHFLQIPIGRFGLRGTQHLYD